MGADLPRMACGRSDEGEREMKIWILGMVLVLLSGFTCSKGMPVETKSPVDKFQVEMLFEVDGCKVYRFQDYLRPVYFTNCKGGTRWTENCGKNCTRGVGLSGGEE